MILDVILEYIMENSKPQPKSFYIYGNFLTMSYNRFQVDIHLENNGIVRIQTYPNITCFSLGKNKIQYQKKRIDINIADPAMLDIICDNLAQQISRLEK